MADRDLSYEELLQILQLVESSPEFTEFHLRYGDIEIDLSKRGAERGEAHTGLPARPVKPAREETGTDAPAIVPPDAAHAVTPEQALMSSPTGHIVSAPMVGTFYRAPEPGATPFVEVGQRVEPDSVVCIIEVMKLMNSVAAGASGVVTHILPADGEAVEFGQTLIVIKPDA